MVYDPSSPQSLTFYWTWHSSCSVATLCPMPSNPVLSRNSLQNRRALSRTLTLAAEAKLGHLVRDVTHRARMFGKAALLVLNEKPAVNSETGAVLDTRESRACMLSREARGCVDSWARLVRLPTPDKQSEARGALIDAIPATPEPTDAELIAVLRKMPPDTSDPAIPLDPPVPPPDVPPGGS